MKKPLRTAAAFTLAAALALPAYAQEPLLISPNPDAGYAASITLNGKALDVSAIPAAEAGYLPMRLIAEGDYGSALWLEEENSGWFYLEGATIQVDFSDMSVTVNDEKSSASAIVKQGVTFLPLEVLSGLEGYTATLEESGVTITTPNGAPLALAAYEIMDKAGMGMNMKVGLDVLVENYGVPAGALEEAVSFFPMNTSPDTLILARLAQGADLEAVKAALETYRQGQEDTFSWYLPGNLPKVQDARLEVSGDYLCFLIAENADEGIAAFHAFVEAQK